MHMGFGVGGACQIVLFGKPRNFGASGLLCKNGTKGYTLDINGYTRFFVDFG
jgi:hypothetical protein